MRFVGTNRRPYNGVSISPSDRPPTGSVVSIALTLQRRNRREWMKLYIQDQVRPLANLLFAYQALKQKL